MSRELLAAETLRRQVLPGYGLDPKTTAIEELRAGHINDSFRVRSGDCDWIAQRINSHVFKKPLELMANMVRVTAHLERRLRATATPDLERRCLRLVATTTGERWHLDSEGEVWRAFPFISGSVTYRFPRDPGMAHEAGRAYGRFQELLHDLDPASLEETIPRFHDTPHRYLDLERAIAEDRAGRASQVAAEIDAAFADRGLASRLLDLQTSGSVPVRVVHNDAKLTNVLLDCDTERALLVVDLDTVMPGLSLFDFGDMARSMGHRSAEDAPDAATIAVDRELFLALAAGYLETATQLNSTERAHLVSAAQVAVLEHIVRFLTDYLDGDRYFRVARENQNLDRARVHIALLRSLAEHERELRSAIERL